MVSRASEGPGKLLLSELVLGGHGANYKQTIPHLIFIAQPPYPSYLALPTVDLETLKTEFQDDSPASGTVLRGRQLAEADVTSQTWPYVVVPQHPLSRLTQSVLIPLPRDRGLSRKPPTVML